MFKTVVRLVWCFYYKYMVQKPFFLVSYYIYIHNFLNFACILLYIYIIFQQRWPQSRRCVLCCKRMYWTSNSTWWSRCVPSCKNCATSSTAACWEYGKLYFLLYVKPVKFKYLRRIELLSLTVKIWYVVLKNCCTKSIT